MWLNHRNNITLSLAMPTIPRIRLELLNSIYNLDPRTRNLSIEKLSHLLLYGSKINSSEINREIIKLTVKFLKLSKH